MTLVDAAILGQRVGRFGGHRPHWLGLLFVALLFVLVVAGIVALITWLSRSRHLQAVPAGAASAPPPPASSVVAASSTLDARRILDERLARGEIDPDEYRARRDALES